MLQPATAGCSRSASTVAVPRRAVQSCCQSLVRARILQPVFREVLGRQVELVDVDRGRRARPNALARRALPSSTLRLSVRPNVTTNRI